MSPGSALPSSKPADLVFTGGPVYTVDPARSWADAVAVRDGRIVAVGGSPAVADLIGSDTQVVDLAGRLPAAWIPGSRTSSPRRRRRDDECVAAICIRRRKTARRLQACVDAIAAYAAAHPDRDWITGGGWSMEAFPGGTPHRELLDAVVCLICPVALREP